MMSKSVILITGTSKGIGKYLADYYSKKGSFVIGCSRGSIDFELANYKHFQLDITNENSVKKMFLEIRKEFGKLDTLINNAGVNYALSPALLVPYESALKTLEINILGTFLMSREAVKLMMKNSFGRIINFGSMAVKHEIKGEAIYTASKAAIVSMTKVFSKEVFDLGITCNVISPSAINTDLLEDIDGKALDEILSRNAINDFGEFEDISNVTDWLMRGNSHKITGQNIYLGGVWKI